MLEQIKSLEFAINKLQLEKLELERKLLATLGYVKYNIGGEILHIAHEGRQTYSEGNYKAVITTDYIYSINKPAYDVLQPQLIIDPITTSRKLEVNKRIYKELELSAPTEDLLLLSDIITRKPAKPHVKVTL